MPSSGNRVDYHLNVAKWNPFLHGDILTCCTANANMSTTNFYHDVADRLSKARVAVLEGAGLIQVAESIKLGVVSDRL